MYQYLRVALTVQCLSLSAQAAQSTAGDASGDCKFDWKAPRRCDSSKDARCDPDWALRQVGAFRAWRLLNGDVCRVAGDGVFIAQMDSGYRAHPAVQPEDETAATRKLTPTDRGPLVLFHSNGTTRLPLKFSNVPSHAGNHDKKTNGEPLRDGCKSTFLDGCAPNDQRAQEDPWDPVPHHPVVPLDALPLPIRQPGHGTKTASIIVGRQCLDAGSSDRGWSGGAAPGARLLPFQVTFGSVLSEGRATQMAEGIQAAADSIWQALQPWLTPGPREHHPD